MRIRLFLRPFLLTALLLPLFSSPAVADDFSFSDARPILRIAYTATTKGELFPCPT